MKIISNLKVTEKNKFGHWTKIDRFNKIFIFRLFLDR